MRSLSKRTHPLLLLLLLLSVPLNAAAQAGKSDPAMTLRLVDWADLDEMPVDEEALAAFQKLHPEIRVLYEPNPGRQYEEKILTALAADSPPDVFLLDSKLIPTFTNKHLLMDLEPYVGKLGIDTAQWYPNVLDIARRGSGLYAFPKGFSPLAVYFNRTTFRAAGIPDPDSGWTWDDYLRIAKALTIDADRDGTPEQYGASFTNYYFMWIPWVWSAGGDVVSPDGRRASGYLNSPQTESALDFLIGLRRRDRVAPDAGSWVQEEKTGTNYALFANGKTSMIVDGHWRMPKFVKFINEGKLQVGVAPFPRHPDGRKVNVVYESGWCVPVNAAHPEQAVLLASFMAGEASCRIRSKGMLEIPANRKVAEEAVALDRTGMERVFLNEIPRCREPWGARIERFSEIEWTLQDAVDEVMLNGKPMHETMTSYASRIDRELQNIRSHENYSFKPIKAHSEILYFLIGVSGASLALCAGLYLWTRRRDRHITGNALVFVAPSLLHLAVFVFTPILFAAYLSVHRWDIVVPDKPFVGLENFSEMLGDQTFWNALLNTLMFSLNVPLGMLVSLGVALMMHRKLTGLGVLRTIYFLPSVTSFVAIALVWMWIYHPSFGAANFLLGVLGLPPLEWLNSARTAMLSLVLFSVWLGMGYQMVIFLAGLQGVPEELHEAARIDGCTWWQRFRHITVPLLKPTTFFILVTSLISSLQVFTAIYVMTAGGPVRSTDTIVYHIYQAAWEQLRMGYASAMSWVMFLIIMAATWVQFKLIGSEVDYG